LIRSLQTYTTLLLLNIKLQTSCVLGIPTYSYGFTSALSIDSGLVMLRFVLSKAVALNDTISPEFWKVGMLHIEKFTPFSQKRV